jgi:hypothetical protein
MPVAVSSSFLFRSLGQLLGVSLSFAIMQWNLDRNLIKSLGPQSRDLIVKIVHNPSTVIPLLDFEKQVLVRLGYLESIQMAFVVVGAFATLLVVLSICMKEYKLK